MLLPIRILSESGLKRRADYSALHDDLGLSTVCVRVPSSAVEPTGADPSASIQSYQEEVHAIWHGKSKQCFA